MKVRLYCFSYVGGSATAYRAWQRFLPPHIVVCPVELPGHTARMKEEPIGDAQQLVALLAQEIEADLAVHPDAQWASYGHCTGAPLSFLVAVKVAQSSGRPPMRSFLAASHPPDEPVLPLATLSDDELFCMLDRMAGTPAGLMKDARMRQLMLPLLRADAQINDACYRDHGVRADWPFTAFAACDDTELQPDAIWRWARFTTAATRTVVLAGGHFQAIRAPQEVLEHIRADLAATQPQPTESP
jgi:medium-chain acyl-[acyl-carrier-protein] hydrolase